VVAPAIPRDKTVRRRVHKDGATAGQVLGKFPGERRADNVGCRTIESKRQEQYLRLRLYPQRLGIA
jgi:hypothetical protein